MLTDRVSTDLSQAGTSDAYYDYTCTSCEDNGRNVEAIFYCKNCEKQYCCQCITFHNKILQEHAVLGRQEVEQWGIMGHVRSTERGEIDMCPRHAGKLLEMYCRDHDRLCCCICITVEHRTCKVVQHLPEVASGVRNSSEFLEMVSQVDDIQLKLQDLQASQSDIITNLEATCTDIKTSVSSSRKRIEQTLADLEENTFKELDEIKQKLVAKLNENIDNIETMAEGFKPFQKVMEEKSRSTDALAYIGYKQCKEQLEDAQYFIHQISQQTYKITLSNYPQIAQCLSSMTTLGKFKVIPDLDNHQAMYKVESKQEHNLKIEGDIKVNEIWGSCLLPGGQIVMADSSNQRVKLLDENYKVLDCYSTFPLCPNDVCHVQDKAVLASLGDRGSQHVVQYMMVNFNNKLMHGKRIPFDHVCGGIAFHRGTRYISSNTALYAYSNRDLTVSRKIYEDLSGKWTIHKFALSADGHVIYMTNMDKNQLVTIDNKGNKLQTFSDPKLKRPTGICVAGNGTVFICGYESATVIQVDKTGQERLATIATHVDGIYAPYSLMFDENTRSLCVGQISENLLVFKMAKDEDDEESK